MVNVNMRLKIKMKNKKCSFVLVDGSFCRANPIKGSSMCFRHNPLLKEAGLLASQKGGQNRALQGRYGQKIKLESASDIKTFLGGVINAVWSGEVPVPVGSSMGFLTRCWLDAYDKSDLEKRIQILEEKMC